MNKYLLCLLAMAAGSISAQQRVYVSTFGNDANPCNTVSQPCATFQGAISKANAGGTVFALDSADFGPVNINSSVTIDGGEHGAFISTMNTGVQIGANAAIVLRNLSIVLLVGANSVTGISGTLFGQSLTLDHVSVSTVGGNGVQTTTGIQLNLVPNAKVNLKDVNVESMQYGILLSPDAGNPAVPFLATLENVSVYASVNGLSAIDGEMTIRNSSFLGGSLSTGITIGANSSAPVSLIENTRIANSNVGIFATGGQTLRLSNDVISRNGTGINASGGATVISYRNNVFAGNTNDGTSALATSLK